MLEVHIDPDNSAEYSFVTVATIDEAMDLIRQKFPSAVRSVGWMADVDPFPIEAAWFEAMLEVWRDRQTMEHSQLGENYCALVTNRGLNPPEPDAKLFDGGVEIDY